MALTPPITFDEIVLKEVNGGFILTAINPLAYNELTTNLTINEASSTATGIVNTSAQTFNGVKTFGSVPKCSTNPTTTDGLTNKGYVDELVSRNLTWKDAVISFYDMTTPPENPTIGDRYISTATVGDFVTNSIYQYNGNSSWLEFTPVEGWALYVKEGETFGDETVTYTQASTWASLGQSIRHQSLIGAGTNTHEDIDNHISDSTTAHFGQNLTSTGNPTFDGVTTSSIALLQGGFTGIIGTNEFGDITLSPDVEAFVEVTGGTKLKVSAPLLTVNRIGNTSGVTTSIEAYGASADVILTSIGTGAKIDMKVNDDNQTDNTLETITKSRHTIYLDADATNPTDGSVHLAGGMSVTKSIHTASSVNCNSATISTGGAICYGDVNLLNGNQKIRFASSNESIYPSSFIEKNAETNLTLRNNGLSNGDYYKDTYGQTVVNLGSTGLSVSTAPASVFPAVERMTVDETSVSIKQTTSSTTTSTGSLILAGGLGVAENINSGGVINATSNISTGGSVIFSNIPTTSNFDHYETFSETKVFNSGITNFNVVCSYVRVGKMVTASFTQSAVVVSANSFLSCLSCVPIQFLPSVTTDHVIIGTNLNSPTTARIIITASNGNVSVYRDVVSNFGNNAALTTIGKATYITYHTS